MNLHPVDWAIVLLFLVFITGIVFWSRKLCRSVAGFLAANRCAGRYLITMAEGMAFIAAVGVVANFENYYRSGFGGSWWFLMMVPVGLFIALSGWVSYRYRETRVLTLAQFFEIRYSRRFRIFAGILAFISGLLNCGIFPAVTANFLIYFCGIPEFFEVAGVSIRTFPVIMVVMISVAVLLATSGGQITIMVTDFFQGLLLNAGFVVILFVILSVVGWGNIVETLKQAPEGQSMLNPFKQGGLESFNVGFFAILAFMRFLMTGVWQGGAGYAVAAKSPHEMRMARILAEWRVGIVFLLFVMMPVAIYTVMNSSLFSEQAVVISAKVSAISDLQVQKQMLVPIGLTQVLPAGVLGIFAAVMIGSAISTDDSYYHSWGSIFIQDVIMPFRKKSFTQKQHVWLLRGAICGIGVFSFLWSLFFPLREYIQMYFQVTAAIYVGGAGCAVIGGLYWKRGTVQGAWSGMITGSALSVGAIVLRIVWPAIPSLRAIAPELPLDGARCGFLAAVAGIVVYVVVSLLTCRIPFNMEKLLHRGVYAVKEEESGPRASPFFLWRLLGINSEFSRGDKVIYLAQFSWTLFWVLVFVVGCIWNLTRDVSDDEWVRWWTFHVALGGVVAVITVIWFSIGGIRDLKNLAKSLRSMRVDHHDDGSVDHPEVK